MPVPLADGGWAARSFLRPAPAMLALRCPHCACAGWGQATRTQRTGQCPPRTSSVWRASCLGSGLQRGMKRAEDPLVQAVG